jgi:diguanylate cyclase (GGDEF)-like protein
MDARAQARRQLELDLREAMSTGAFEMHYQPLVDLRTNAIPVFEALLRWNHADRGWVSPETFISVAEETGLIVPLGEWALRQACAEAAKWPGNTRVAVNLSPIQFKNGNLVPAVVSALSASGLPAKRLELEITEAVLLERTDDNLGMLRQLRDLGVRISMDDFGTGYSSLSYLRSFEFDKIKIDKSFIRNLANEPESRAIVRAIAALGASLGMVTVAEGVETAEQLRCLEAEGCTEIQGFHVSRPIPASEVLETLRGGGPNRSGREAHSTQIPDFRVAAFEGSPDGLLMLTAERDEARKIINALVRAVNGRAAEYIGYPVGRLLDHRFLKVLPKFRDNGVWELCLKVFEHQKAEDLRVHCDFRGLDTWFQISATPLGDGCLLTLRDITYLQYSAFEADVLRLEAEDALQSAAAEISARECLESELRKAALTDALTGALNRRGFDEVLAKEADSAKQDGQPLAVVAIDLDHFKEINDRFGHAAGDKVLRSLASLVMQEIRLGTDFLGRIGGEEFAVLCPHTTTLGARVLAERIRTRLAEAFLIEGSPIRLTASFGISSLGAASDTAQMLSDADKALYEAKRSGRDCIVMSS